MAGMEGHGVARIGPDRRGVAWQVWQVRIGIARRGVAGCGEAGQVRQ